MGRSPCCSKEGLNRGAWTAMEDKILTDYIKAHGEGKWRNVPKKAGLRRCGKSCRLRWLNYLRPDIKRGNITRDEEELIIRLHKLLGNRWSLIAGRLPGRTDNEIKNYWNTNIGKRMQSQAMSSTSNHKPTRQCKKTPNPTIERPVDLPLSVMSEPSVVPRKASKSSKVLMTPEPNKNDQRDTKPAVLVGPSGVQEMVDHKVDRLASLLPFASKEEYPSDFMMDLEMDERFLSEFLNSDFSQMCNFDNGVQRDNNTSTSHGSHSSPNSDQALLFSDERRHESSLQPLSSFLDSELDWFRD